MKLIYVLLFLIGSNVRSADEECGGTVLDLWLDIVIVADNSQRVNQNNSVVDIQNSISNIFEIVPIPINRVGFVTYNSLATINADLNKFKSWGDLSQGVNDSYNNMNLSSENTSFIGTGLITAGELLQVQGSAIGRVYYPKVIIVYASAFNGTGLLDPLSVANTLKSAGITIITVAVDTDNNGVIQKQLASIASPGSAFSLDPDDDHWPVREALINANCFCPPGWTQRQEFYRNKFKKYASCFQFIGTPSAWNFAYFRCLILWSDGSYLAMENEPSKQKFILEAVRNNSAFQQTPLQYHIGLNMIGEKWVWETSDGPQQELGWNDWMDSYPVISSSMTSVMNVQNGASSGWQNIDPDEVMAGYVCEAKACSASRFCYIKTSNT